MPKDAYYIKLDSNTAEDLKVKALRKIYGIAGFGRLIFLYLILRSEDSYRLEYDDSTWESLSSDLEYSPEEVKKFVDDCIGKFKQKGIGIFIKEDGYFFSVRLNRDMQIMEEKRKKTSKAGLISAEKRFGKNYREDDDANKYTEGRYGHMVVATPADFEKHKALKKQRTTPKRSYDDGV